MPIAALAKVEKDQERTGSRDENEQKNNNLMKHGGDFDSNNNNLKAVAYIRSEKRQKKHAMIPATLFWPFFLAIISLATVNVSGQVQESVRIALLDVETRDTLFSAPVDSSTTGTYSISYKCGNRKYENDMASSFIITKSRSWNGIVPMKANTLNTYTFSYVPKESINWEFSGNPYTEAFQSIFDDLNRYGDPGDSMMLQLIDRLAIIQKKFPNSQMTGYIAYSICRSLGKDFIKTESKQRQANWKIITTGEGTPYEKMCQNTKTLSCIDHPFNELHYQSETTPIDVNLLEGYIHVMVFWDPKNPDVEALKELSTISKQLSAQKVFFTAIATGTYEEIRQFRNTHPSCDGLNFIHDSQYCMTNVYLRKHTIASSPAIFLFDRNGKMAYVGALTSEVKGLVELLLKKN